MNGKGSLVCTILMGGLAPGFLLNNNFLLFHANANKTLQCAHHHSTGHKKSCRKLSNPKSLNASGRAA